MEEKTKAMEELIALQEQELEEEVRRAHAEVMRLEAALEEPRHQLAEAEAAQAR